MQIFLSYPSEERPTAERIHLALGAAGHEVFFDREDLPAGDAYDRTVRRAMRESAILVFLVTPGSIARGRYTLTELKLAEERWPQPGGRVLPVMLRPTPIDLIPAYLRAVSILEPSGDVVAEVASEADRMLVSHSLYRRAGRWLGSAFGIATVLLVALAAVTAWRFQARIADALGLSALGGGALPADIRQRARSVNATPEGYAIIATLPPEIVRFDVDDHPLGNPLPLRGEVVAVRQLPRHLLIATRDPDEIVVVDMGAWSTIDTLALGATPIAGDSAALASRRVTSIEYLDGVMWATTGGTDGNAALLRMRPTGEWVVATTAMTVPPEPPEYDARGLRLHAIGPALWALASDSMPSRLYRIWGTIRVDRIAGESAALIACAHDLAASADGNMLAFSCDGQLQEIVEDGSSLSLLHSRPVVASGTGLAGSTTERITTDGPDTFVTLNTTTSDAAARPLRARIAHVRDQGSELLFDERDVSIASIAVTPRALLVSLRRADGRWDARRIDRRP